MAAAFVDSDREKLLLSLNDTSKSLFASKLSEDPGALVFQSKHPYEDNENTIFEVSIPDAKAVGIIFAEETTTERQCDFVQFLKSADGSEHYGLEKYSGGSGGSSKCFPGVGGMQPLIIPASKFWVKFVSDG